jgi:ankyrin repeat protein
MAEFHKLSCIDSKKECNIIEPISLTADLNGNNPLTGRPFNKDDNNTVERTHRIACANSDGNIGKCCDPRDFRIQNNPSMKNLKFKQNKTLGQLRSLEVCYSGDKSRKCPGDNWMDATPYLMCKIGDNTLPSTQDNVVTYHDDALNIDCPLTNCGVPKIRFGDLIKGTGKALESKVLQDIRIREMLKDDNHLSLKSDVLDNCLLRYKKQCPNIILTDNDDGDTLLIGSIKVNADKCVSLLLSNGADITLKDAEGKTPLIHATIHSNPNIISLLVNAGADIGDIDNKGRNCLHYAAMYNDHNMVNYLLSLGPHLINQIDKNGNSILHSLCGHGKDIGRIAKLLLSHGLSSLLKNKNDKTATDLCQLRKKILEKNEFENNSKIFLEGFSGAIVKAEEQGDTPNTKIGQLISELDTASTYLDRSNVAENKMNYSGFISANDNLQGPVNFVTKACYPYDEALSEEECLSRNGKWIDFHPEDLNAVASVSYDNNDDDQEEEVNTNLTSQDQLDEQRKRQSDNYYYNFGTDPVPVKNLNGLDHDSIMGINKPTPSPTLLPTLLPNLEEEPEKTSIAEHDYEFYKYLNTNTALFLMILLLLMAGLTIGFMWYRKS